MILEMQNVCKTFIIPHEKRDTLREHFLGFFCRKEYERFFALRDISFQLRTGEWLGIVGPNGSGKSTLLRILADIFRPDSGHVHVEGKIVPLLELGVGFHPDLTVRQNIFLNGTLLGLDRERIKKEIASMLQFAELTQFQDAKLKNLSSGMTMRLAFSIAIKTDGDVFLLDEVWAVGDGAFQKKCTKVLEALRKKGKTVVLVSHNLHQVQQFCDRCILLKKGKIIADGSPEDVIAHYEKN